MDFRKIPNGNGQKVYLALVNPLIQAKYYSEVRNHLQQNGYTIIEDNKDIDKDTYFLVLQKGIYPQSEIYYRIEKLILAILKKYNIVKPETVSFITNPPAAFSYPFVVKNELEHGGKDKYLIKNEEQFRNFVMQNSNYQKYVIQRYINTPTKYNTSLRVITSGSGDILCSSLLYADKTLLNSLYDEKMVSNVLSGGHSILLEKDNYTPFEQEILTEHNISEKLPDNINSACIEMAVSLNRYLGAICGIDFIYSEEEQKWYYLEAHDFPMLFPYVEKYQLPYHIPTFDYGHQIDFAHLLSDSKNLDNLLGYLEQVSSSQLADIDARLNSLSLHMKKKVKR
ncbi:MAG: hypothetical protein IJR82_03930 [Bacilli bacterium]|nr:hypothetical protein [Bacilli bacterium]